MASDFLSAAIPRSSCAGSANSPSSRPSRSQESQREQFATLTLNTAVELTAAALRRLDVAGSPGEQAESLRKAMQVLFPEAVALVSAARQGFMRER